MARRKSAVGEAGAAAESGLWEGEDRNYRNSFILVAPDCTATTGIVPVSRGGKLTVPALEYQLLSSRPYSYTQNEVQFEVHARHKGVGGEPTVVAAPRAVGGIFQPAACLPALFVSAQDLWLGHSLRR